MIRESLVFVRIDHRALVDNPSLFLKKRETGREVRHHSGGIDANSLK